jgi:hypothetical protein
VQARSIEVASEIEERRNDGPERAFTYVHERALCVKYITLSTNLTLMGRVARKPPGFGPIAILAPTNVDELVAAWQIL